MNARPERSNSATRGREVLSEDEELIARNWRGPRCSGSTGWGHPRNQQLWL